MQSKNDKVGPTKLGGVVLGLVVLTLFAVGAHFLVPGGLSGIWNKLAPGAAVSSDDTLDPINVCVVTWGGYAGGEYFNGGFEASRESRFYRDYGIAVKFTVMDDFVASRDAWKNGECDLLWATVDAFTTEAHHLQNAGFDPVFLFQADWSRGGDAVVATSIVRSMNDLRGKRVAFAYNTPSHTFILRMLESAGMSIRDITPVDTGNPFDATNAFKAGQVEAAVVWSPDDDACLKAVHGSHVLVSTREASHIIADGFFASKKYMLTHEAELRGLVEGWLIGAAEINTNPSARREAARILARGLNTPENEADNAIGRVRLTTYGDNLQFFGLEPGAVMTGERLFVESAALYQNNGYLDLVPSVPPWRSVSYTNILRDITTLTGPMHKAEVQTRFTPPTEAMAAEEAFSTKSLSVTFPTGSAELDYNAKQVIDLGFVPTVRGFERVRVRIEGNTDDTGSDAVNIPLSERRANAVAGYLATEYGFDRNKFVVKGNGSTRPVCYDETDECRARNRRTEFRLLPSVEAE